VPASKIVDKKKKKKKIKDKNTKITQKLGDKGT